MTSAHYQNNCLSAIHEYKSLYNITIPQTSQFLVERVHRPTTYSAGRKDLQSNVNSISIQFCTCLVLHLVIHMNIIKAQTDSSVLRSFN